MPIHARIAFLLCFAFPTLASADPCPGASPFTDVPASESYCTNTEWLRNRGITIGCTATEFCPGAPVTRAQMALFLNRLGEVITPDVFIQGTSSILNVDLDASPPARVCTSINQIGNYPRRVLVQATFSGLAGGALDYEASLASSNDNGVTFSPIPNTSARNGTSGARWTTVTLVGTLTAAVGQVRTAILLDRVNGPLASTEDFTEYECTMRFIEFNRNGTSAPFDQTLLMLKAP
jgi:hypothetical protein